MNSKEAVKKRTELLKKLREEHRESVEQMQALLKEHKKVQQQICQMIRVDAHTIPEMAKEMSMAADQVLWHVTALKKYGVVVETGMCGDYYLYQRSKEKADERD